MLALYAVAKMDRPVFVVNLKNYAEILGESALLLATTAELVSTEVDVDIMVAPPAPSLAAIAEKVSVPVISQKVDDSVEGKSTGAVIPEALSAWGCAGSLINHAEAKIPLDSISRLIPRMKRLNLVSCVCVEKTEELVSVAAWEPEYIAVEPPELIGTGVSVSHARPELVSDSVKAAEGAGYGGRVLCGAGIVSAADVRRAVELGAKGILVASSLIKSSDWNAKMKELASALL